MLIVMSVGVCITINQEPFALFRHQMSAMVIIKPDDLFVPSRPHV